MGLFNNLGTNIATLGQAFGLPDFGISERVSGSQTQNQPYSTFGRSVPSYGGGGQVQGAVSFQSPQQQQPTSGFGALLNQPSGGGGGGGGGGYTPDGSFSVGYNGPGSGSPTSSYEDQMRGSINSGWDSYTNQLNDMLNTGLPGQRNAQEAIANESLTSGVNQLGSQRAQSEQAVNKQQGASLKDLGENIQNLFQSGNVYLGARGAGDSSAANQYSYAISKMGSKARGDIMSQVSDRMNQIGDIFNNEKNRLESEKNTRVAQIADWFNGAQNQIRSQIGQAGVGRSQDIQALSTNVYNQAMQAMQTVQGEMANRRSSLESWAMSNSKNVQELMANMQGAQQMPGFQGLQGGMPQVTAEGRQFLPTGAGAVSNTTEDQNRGIFG